MKVSLRSVTIILLFIYLSSVAFGGEKLTKHLDKVVFGGLEQVLKKKYLRVLTTRNAYDYYIYQGKTSGIQYEMAREFTKYLNEKYVYNTGIVNKNKMPLAILYKRKEIE